MNAHTNRPPSVSLLHGRVRLTPARRLAFFLVVDILLIALSVLGAFALRFDGTLPPGAWRPLAFTFVLAVAATVGALHLYGIYRVSWGHVGLRDIVAVAVATAFSGLVLLAVLLLWQNRSPFTILPKSLAPIQASLAFLGLAGFRLAKRFRQLLRAQRADATVALGTATLIVGAGDAGEQVLRSILDTSLRQRHRVVGFVDDDPLARGTSLHSVPVLGSVADLPTLLRQHRVEEVVIAISGAGSATVRRIMEPCRAAGVHNVRIVPPLSQLLEGPVTFASTKAVSLEDLLGRETVEIRPEDVAELLSGRRVVVTGGAGTIGAELCRQVARFGPERLVVLDVDETRLHDVALDLREAHPGVQVVEALVDVRRASELERLFAVHRPDVVFHAAAFKHVPMMEAWPLAALEVNVLGTANVAKAAQAAGASHFVLISTDKAVEPSSIMGASKRLAEMVLFSGRGMVRSAVRFGNVIGSRGSVIPIFERQLAHGGPLTVTHPDVERFFMMTSEAVSLVLQAAALGKGRDIFVLDMGKPVRILDVAREFCRLKGFEPGVDVSIVFTGLRPGEKLVEVLHYPFEKLAPAGHERILRAEAGDIASPPGLLGEARGLVEAGDQGAARRCFERWFPSLRAGAEGARAATAPLHPPAGR